VLKEGNRISFSFGDKTTHSVDKDKAIPIQAWTDIEGSKK